jgi:hypothetical protein
MAVLSASDSTLAASTTLRHTGYAWQAIDKANPQRKPATAYRVRAAPNCISVKTDRLKPNYEHFWHLLLIF